MTAGESGAWMSVPWWKKLPPSTRRGWLIGEVDIPNRPAAASILTERERWTHVATLASRRRTLATIVPSLAWEDAWDLEGTKYPPGKCHPACEPQAAREGGWKHWEERRKDGSIRFRMKWLPAGTLCQRAVTGHGQGERSTLWPPYYLSGQSKKYRTNVPDPGVTFDVVASETAAAEKRLGLREPGHGKFTREETLQGTSSPSGAACMVMEAMADQGFRVRLVSQVALARETTEALLGEIKHFEDTGKIAEPLPDNPHKRGQEVRRRDRQVRLGAARKTLAAR